MAPLPNENIPYLLVGGFSVIFAVFWFSGGKHVIPYIIDSLKSKKRNNKPEKISRHKKTIEPSSSSVVITNTTTPSSTTSESTQQRKGQFLYDSIKNDLSGFTDIEEKQYVADILWNLQDEEFDEIIARYPK